MEYFKLNIRSTNGNFSTNENGQIIIGTGISDIEISLSTMGQAEDTNDFFQMGIVVVKNEDWAQCQRGCYNQGKNQISCILAGVTFKVTKGDILTVYTNSNLRNYTVNANRTYGIIKSL